MRAVWQALAARGVRYDATDPALARGPSVWSQRVRSPDEVIRIELTPAVEAIRRMAEAQQPVERVEAKLETLADAVRAATGPAREGETPDGSGKRWFGW